MTPIKWTVERARGDPARSAKKLIANRPREGVVFVQDPVGNADLLRFSAVAACGSETPLLLGLIAAFSVSEGIRKDTGIISWVRWPGIVTIEGKSVATASASVTSATGAGRVELDFRINILHSELTDSTSLYDELGVEVDRRLLLDKILESLSWMHFGWSNGMHQQLLRRITSMTETIGSRVSMRKGGAQTVGSAVEIDALGRLVVRLDDGKTTRLEAGDELSHA